MRHPTVVAFLAALATTPAGSIEGPTWRLVSLRGQEESALAATPRGVTARFTSGRVEGFSGCNSYGGAYTIDADRLALGPLAGTMMACPEPAMALENAIWEVTGFNNGRQAVLSPLLGTALTLSFSDGAVVGHSGCNTYRAGYTRDGSRLTIGPAAATRKACAAEGVMGQEQQFLAALQSATSWTIRGDVLDLHRADGARALFARRGQTE